MTRRRRANFALAAIACAVGAVLLLAAGRPTRTTASGAGAPSARTPLWSARRVPALLVRTVQHAAQTRAGTALTNKLREIIAPVRACVAVDDADGSLARIDIDRALAPASTLKLLTAATALNRLGPDHRFTTRAFADAGGNLVVVGAGDPLLATGDFVKARGKG